MEKFNGLCPKCKEEQWDSHADQYDDCINGEHTEAKVEFWCENCGCEWVVEYQVTQRKCDITKEPD